MKPIVTGVAGLAAVGVLAAGAYLMSGPTTVDLGQMVIGVHHVEMINVPGGEQFPQVIDVKSSNPSVATATAYGVGQVQVAGVAPGKTDVEFFDAATRVLYKKLVWVETNVPKGD